MITKNITVFATPDNTIAYLKLFGLTIYRERLVNRKRTGYLFGLIPIYIHRTSIVKRDAIPEAYVAEA